jgi:pyruvate/2-oxoacid:ferredoxin oxidoreductase beta subunit
MTEEISTIKQMPGNEYFMSGHGACPGCGVAVAVKNIMRMLGNETTVYVPASCLIVFTSSYPTSAFRTPFLFTAFENTGAVISGIKAAHRRRGIKDTVVGFAGDGGTFDIGLQALSGAAEREEDVLYVCVDNEAYMNTGIQRSSSTPFGASTTTSPAGKMQPAGQMTWKKDMTAIAAAHGIPYTATACPSYYADLINKVQKAKAVNGPSYLHVLSVCPTGWRIPPQKSIEYGKLAVDSGIFPLYEVENGVWRLSRKTKKLVPVADYFKGQGRYRHLDDRLVAYIQEKINERWERLVKLCGADEEKESTE